jgi:MFS family permease
VWFLVRGNAVGWTSVEVVSALAAGVVLVLAFVLWEMKTPEPMLPMRFFARRAFSAPIGASFFLFAALYGSVFFLAQFLQTVMDYSPLTSGLLLVPWTATLILIAPIAGAVGDRVGERPLVVAGLAVNAAGLAAVAVLAGPGLAYWQLLVALLITGIGASTAIPVVQSALIGAVADSDIGKASGANNMVQELGGAFGVAILVATFSAAGGYGTAAAFDDGFTPAFITCAALALAGAAAGLMMPGRQR